MVVGSRQNDPGPPSELVLYVAACNQRLKRYEVDKTKVKASVGASHAPNMTY